MVRCGYLDCQMCAAVVLKIRATFLWVNSAFYPPGVDKSSTGLYGTLAGVKAGCVHLRWVESNTV